MAIKCDITAANHWFLGEDKILRFSAYDPTTGLAIDVTSWTLKWAARRYAQDPDPAVIQKTSGGGGISVVGVFNESRALNTQRITVTISAADTLSLPQWNYWHALKRMDTSTETVLAYGELVLRASAAR